MGAKQSCCWLVLHGPSLLFVAIDVRTTPEALVMRSMLVLVTAFAGIIGAILAARLPRLLTVSEPAADYEPNESKYDEEDESEENSMATGIFTLMALA
jgi:hypothetical protein